ncbi:MAG: hypothetical protein ACE148_06780 [Vicinamibacterales bacterium]
MKPRALTTAIVFLQTLGAAASASAPIRNVPAGANPQNVINDAHPGATILLAPGHPMPEISFFQLTSSRSGT